jgi:hypothetical protein
MKNSLKSFLKKMEENNTGVFADGFRVLKNVRGGSMISEEEPITNKNLCQNDGTCTGTNSNVCSNNRCGDATNTGCTNYGTCFA